MTVSRFPARHLSLSIEGCKVPSRIQEPGAAHGHGFPAGTARGWDMARKMLSAAETSGQESQTLVQQHCVPLL